MIGWSTYQRPELLAKQPLLLLLVVILTTVTSSFALPVLTSSSSNTISTAEEMNSSRSIAHGRGLLQTSSRREGRFLTQEERKPAHARRLSGQYLCRWKQEICEQEPISFLLGPDCCNSVCTNVKTDIFNCGACGRVCFYGSICCNGDCVDIFRNIRHCGACHNNCPFGALCQYGICGYS